MAEALSALPANPKFVHGEVDSTLRACSLLQINIEFGTIVDHAILSGISLLLTMLEMDSRYVENQ